MAIGAAVLLLATEWVVIHSATFAKCVAEQAPRRAQEQQQLPSYALALVHDFGFWLACNAHVVYETRDIFTVFSTVLLAGFTYRIWTGADDTLEHLRESSRNELRAYVSVTFRDVYSDDNTDVPDGYMVTAINHGETPALRCSVSMQMNSLKHSDIDAFTFPEALDGDPTGDLVVNKEAPRTFRSKALAPKLGAAEWMTITEGEEKRLYCWGVARYTDVFGNRHWTRFCFYQGGPLVFDSTGEKLPTRLTSFCHRHNDTSDAPDPTLPFPAAVQPGLEKQKAT
jgi:hypothetical protein